ncbi:unnamed protein product [Euphydryas editha]|uniref:Reverse transcriptase domain-containing protein n=1 Tax=Euphydryas editha TaxID=104508 RepID=A0AAU9UGC0_EUPED|nr:unnamed protein product [Euphydryas editha]
MYRDVVEESGYRIINKVDKPLHQRLSLTTNALWKEHKHNPEDKTKHAEFITKRNEVAKMIQQAKSSYYLKSFAICNKKPAKMWSLINSLSSNKIKESGGSAMLHINNKSNLFGDSGVCETGSTTHSLTDFSFATTDEINKIIDNLNSNTSSGIDGINTKSIKCLKNLIINELTQSINNCLRLGTFPDSLKIAKVTPVYKAGSKTDPGNYRPISVLPVLSKIFERVIYNRLEQYLSSQNFIYERQYGFRPRSNTLSAMTDTITKIKQNIDKKHIAVGIFIDLKKAFDTVSHDILLNKLTKIGITGTAH